MIRLGLDRMHRLLAEFQPNFRIVHVAGTNGKGSVCAACSAMLRSAGLRVGRFTSPHLIDYWDSIQLNGRSISRTHFESLHDHMVRLDQKHRIEASPFELLTATALHAFQDAHVDVAVVEVGVGGRDDATNVVKEPLVAVITRIGLDHADLLGNDLDSIAAAKAGIIKPQATVVVDGSNVESVLEVVRHQAIEAGAASIQMVRPETVTNPTRPAHVEVNQTLAYAAATSVLRQLNRPWIPAEFVEAGKAELWPGRLQSIDISAITGRTQPVLLDGAHNPQAASALVEAVNPLRTSQSSQDGPVTWLLAFSQAKNVSAMLQILLKPNDRVVTVAFEPVEGMPWVQAMASRRIAELAQAASDVKLGHIKACSSVLEGLHAASQAAAEGPMVIAGSLYLVGDVLRLLRDQDHHANQLPP